MISVIQIEKFRINVWLPLASHLCCGNWDFGFYSAIEWSLAAEKAWNEISYIGFIGLCKKHSLKDGILPFCFKKVSLKMLSCQQNPLILKNWSGFAQKQGNNFHCLLLKRQIKVNFCLLFMSFRVKKSYLK